MILLAIIINAFCIVIDLGNYSVIHAINVKNGE